MKINSGVCFPPDPENSH